MQESTITTWTLEDDPIPFKIEINNEQGEIIAVFHVTSDLISAPSASLGYKKKD